MRYVEKTDSDTSDDIQNSSSNISTSSDINVSIRLRDIPVSGVLSAGSGQNQSDWYTIKPTSLQVSMLTATKEAIRQSDKLGDFFMVQLGSLVVGALDSQLDRLFWATRFLILFFPYFSFLGRALD